MTVHVPKSPKSNRAWNLFLDAISDPLVPMVQFGQMLECLEGMPHSEAMDTARRFLDLFGVEAVWRAIDELNERSIAAKAPVLVE